MHLTGLYPEWWEGVRFEGPIQAMGGSVTAELTRDGMQRILLGRGTRYGTGTVPAAKIAGKPMMARGIPNAVASFNVRHVSGGQSSFRFSSYEKGREKWQADTLDLVWFDEEPPLDIYTEGLTRTNITLGPVLLTFTPLLGVSDVVGRFLIEKPPGISVTSMTIDDAEHYTEEQREAIIASYPAHEREARSRGIPTLGSGRIFPVEEARVTAAPFPIPDSWPQLGGVDFGWDHPTAAVRIAHDRDGDTVYVTQTYRVREQPAFVHAAALRAWSPKLLWAWPHDGLQHDKASGEQLAEQYRSHALAMLSERAQFEDGTSGVEAGLDEMLERMQTGRLRVFAHLSDWFEEFRLYHRKDGRVVKERDDLMAATRYAVMMLRHAKPMKVPERRAPQARFQGSEGWMR